MCGWKQGMHPAGAWQLYTSQPDSGGCSLQLASEYPDAGAAVPRRALPCFLQGGDEGTAAAVKTGQLPRKLAARQKVMRSAAILAAAHNAKPAAKVVPRKAKGSVLQQEQRAKQQQQRAAGTAGSGGSSGGARKRGSSGGAGARDEAAALDIWGEPGEAAGQPAENEWVRGEGVAAEAVVAPPAKRAKRSGRAPACGAVAPAAAAGAGSELRRPAVPAVEIDPAGCSYNPDVELHQEAVATAVAAETRKLLDKVGKGAGGMGQGWHVDCGRGAALLG